MKEEEEVRERLKNPLWAYKKTPSQEIYNHSKDKSTTTRRERERKSATL